MPNEKNDAELDSPPAKKKRIGFFQTYDVEYLKVGFIICPGSIFQFWNSVILFSVFEWKNQRNLEFLKETYVL